MAPTETIILEIGSGIPGLGIALITGWLVGTLMARRQYGVVMPLGLLLAAVALLPWWVRLVISFFLLWLERLYLALCLVESQPAGA